MKPKNLVRSALAAAALSLAAAASAQTTIDFWYAVGGDQGATLQEMITEFNATNEWGIRVNATFSGSYGDTAQKVMASLEAGALPQGGLIPAGPLWTCRVGNYLLEEYMAGEEGLSEDYFFPVLLEYNRYDGHLCSLPFNNSTMVMFYNKDLMARAGLDPEAPPQTWDELVAQATAIVENVPGSIGVEVRDEAWWLKGLILQNGGQIVNDDATAPTFQEEAGVGALQFWKDLIDAGLMPPGQHDVSRDLFLAGRVGFLMASTASVATVSGGASFDFGTAMLPGNVRRGTTVGGAALVMFPSTPEKELATWRLLKFLTSVDNSIKFTIATGYVPISPAAAESEAIRTLLRQRPEYAAGFEQLAVSSQYPHFFSMGTMDNLLVDAIEAVELGGRTPAAALAAAAEALIADIAANQ
ncbi:MAG TPA: ABC transporter substrate-binding protein [Trueperaceae bacterium]|nr:ABC transporter substrate-binding protein [Trueperaceae bacterium]